MRISHKHKFVFLSKPKCASTSIRKALDPYTDISSTDKKRHYHHHVPASLLKQHFERMGWNWNSYFKFISIRNPWDMLVSLYFYAKPDHRGIYWWETARAIRVSEDIVEKYPYNPNTRMPFKEWIKTGKSWDLKQQIYLEDLSTYTLPYYVFDDQNNFLVDYVIRVEHLEEDLDFVSSKLGIQLDSLKINTSKHDHYSQYYDSESQAIVSELFEYDINYGKYSF
ncbi:MAG: sulfotransferase family protein [Moorea sp. SIO4G2]|uniref:sulfotransferase family 2 domain-containing protein n=1 Tax=Moorena sp. SIO3I6 TaxID=2607831 RepID=UPI0013F9B84C|nr:sulfotransferase family 2 domain-containing protein [Moorena sp. SIO3I6]NEO65494.1 sulfotransferase family protein [Moorena sp. SIO4G2]NEP29626.1 sulfotransferase family protein [Moorena sp. SIO3I6]